MHFDRTIDWQPDADGVFRGEVDDSWSQGRSIFGGVVSAGALRALKTLAVDRDLVELHTRYVAPLAPGPVHAEIAVLREGRSLTQVEARIAGSDGLAAIVSGSLGVRRTSVIEVAGDRRPDSLPDPEGLTPLPYIPEVTPAFLQHCEMRWTEGGAPFTGQTEPSIGGWVRIPGTTRSGEEVAVALLDVFPTPVLPMLDRPAPASTLAWSAWIHDVPDTGEGFWWYRERAHAAAHGIAVSVGYLYAPDGRLAATKGQSAAVYG